MEHRTTRRALAFGSGAAAAALVLASAAYACTSLQGRLTVTGLSSTQSVAVGHGPLAHTYCSVSGGAQAQAGDSITVDVASYVNTGPGDACPTNGFAPSNDAGGGPTWVRNPECWVGDAPLPTCSQSPYGFHHLEGKGVGAYEVRVVAGQAYSVSGTTYSHTFGFGSTDSECFEGATTVASPWDIIGTFTVAANGTGTWTGNISSSLALSGPTDAAGVCVHAIRSQVAPPAPSLADPWSLVYSNYWVDHPERADYGDHQFTNMAPLLVIL